MSYHDDSSVVSKTMLNLFCDSPLEFYLTYRTGELKRKVASRQMIFGTLMHAILLEQKQLDDLVEVYPKSCYKSNNTLNSKPAREFEQSIAPKVAVKPDVIEQVIAALDALKDTLVSQAVQEATEFERTYRATLFDVPCKCRPDMLVQYEDLVVMYDLKFCDPSPDGFMRSAKRFRYWLQDAHYSAVVGKSLNKPTRFRFLAIEPVFPFRVKLYTYDETSRDNAAAYHRKKLKEFAECERTGDWRDQWNGMLTLSPWEVDDSSVPELEGFDDETEEANEPSYF